MPDLEKMGCPQLHGEGGGMDFSLKIVRPRWEIYRQNEPQQAGSSSRRSSTSKTVGEMGGAALTISRSLPNRAGPPRGVWSAASRAASACWPRTRGRGPRRAGRRPAHSGPPGAARPLL